MIPVPAPPEDVSPRLAQLLVEQKMVLTALAELVARLGKKRAYDRPT